MVQVMLTLVRLLLKHFGNTTLSAFRDGFPLSMVLSGLWLLVRFPTIHLSEQHYLVSQPSPDYLTATGDARIASTQAPQELKVKEIFCGSNSDVRLGYQPYGQWWRTHPNVVHSLYDELEWVSSFVSTCLVTSQSLIIFVLLIMTLFFRVLKCLGHWLTNMHINAKVFRAFP